MSVSVELKWLLAIIDSVKYVEGDTRLQKYGLLIYKKIPEVEFFEDWKPWLYGVYSRKLTKGLQLLQKLDYVITNPVNKGFNKVVKRYQVSETGKKEIESLKKESEDIIKRISEITNYYFSKPLKELLADVYLMYPKYADNSTIKAEVNREKTKRTPQLSPEFEIPYDNDDKLESVLSDLVTTQSQTEHVFNDEDLREKLSRLIGLTSVPKLDPKSFDRLAGILKNKIKTKEIDSVELVRSFRGS